MDWEDFSQNEITSLSFPSILVFPHCEVFTIAVLVFAVFSEQRWILYNVWTLIFSVILSQLTGLVSLYLFTLFVLLSLSVQWCWQMEEYVPWTKFSCDSPKLCFTKDIDWHLHEQELACYHHRGCESYSLTLGYFPKSELALLQPEILRSWQLASQCDASTLSPTAHAPTSVPLSKALARPWAVSLWLTLCSDWSKSFWYYKALTRETIRTDSSVFYSQKFEKPGKMNIVFYWLIIR